MMIPTFADSHGHARGVGLLGGANLVRLPVQLPRSVGFPVRILLVFFSFLAPIFCFRLFLSVGRI